VLGRPPGWDGSRVAIGSSSSYVLVFTTRCSGSAAEVLELYGMRWQIELVFKRLKSLAQLGHVPKYDDRSSRARVYGNCLSHC
jgi:IS4 transposase